jgi:hypothetical protein
VGCDCSVGITTRYRLDSPGTESGWGEIFPYPQRPALGPTQPSVQWVLGLFPGVERAVCDENHLRPSNAEVKERVGLHLYSPSMSSWPVLDRTFC